MQDSDDRIVSILVQFKQDSAGVHVKMEANDSAMTKAGEQKQVGYKQNLEQTAMVNTREQEKDALQFQTNSRLIYELEQTRNLNAELTRCAILALNDMQQIMKDHAILLRGLARLPEAISELRVAQQQITSHIQCNGGL